MTRALPQDGHNRQPQFNAFAFCAQSPLGCYDQHCRVRIRRSRRWIGATEGPVVANVSPEPARRRLVLGQDRNRRVVGVLPGQKNISSVTFVTLALPIRYSPAAEALKPDEKETSTVLKTTKDYGHAVRSVRAKARGVPEGTLTVDAGLPLDERVVLIGAAPSMTTLRADLRRVGASVCRVGHRHHPIVC